MEEKDIVYAVINEGEIVYASRYEEEAQRYANEQENHAVTSTLDEWDIDDLSTEDIEKVSYPAEYDREVYEVYEVDISDKTEDDTIEILTDNGSYKSEVSEIFEILEKSENIVYAVINEGKVVYASRCEEVAQRYASEQENHAVTSILYEWDIDDPSTEDIERACYQAGYDGEVYEVCEIDISGKTEDDTIEIITDNGDCEIEVLEIFEALRKPNRYEYEDEDEEL